MTSPIDRLVQMVRETHKPCAWGSGFCVGCKITGQTRDGFITSGTRADECPWLQVANEVAR